MRESLQEGIQAIRLLLDTEPFSESCDEVLGKKGGWQPSCQRRAKMLAMAAAKIKAQRQRIARSNHPGTYDDMNAELGRMEGLVGVWQDINSAVRAEAVLEPHSWEAAMRGAQEHHVKLSRPYHVHNLRVAVTAALAFDDFPKVWAILSASSEQAGNRHRRRSCDSVVCIATAW
jgi:hypothetical protein